MNRADPVPADGERVEIPALDLGDYPNGKVTIRGGGWHGPAATSRVANGNAIENGWRYATLGFRMARSVP